MAHKEGEIDLNAPVGNATSIEIEDNNEVIDNYEPQPAPAFRSRFIGSRVATRRARIGLDWDDRIEHVSRPPPKNRRLPREAVYVLQSWFITHLASPYPTDAVRRRLAEEAGITGQQVSNWFINARKRYIPRLAAGGALPGSPLAKAIRMEMNAELEKLAPLSLDGSSAAGQDGKDDGDGQDDGHMHDDDDGSGVQTAANKVMMEIDPRKLLPKTFRLPGGIFSNAPRPDGQPAPQLPANFSIVERSRRPPRRRRGSQNDNDDDDDDEEDLDAVFMRQQMQLQQQEGQRHVMYDADGNEIPAGRWARRRNGGLGLTGSGAGGNQQGSHGQQGQGLTPSGAAGFLRYPGNQTSRVLPRFTDTDGGTEALSLAANRFTQPNALTNLTDKQIFDLMPLFASLEATEVLALCQLNALEFATLISSVNLVIPPPSTEEVVELNLVCATARKASNLPPLQPVPLPPTMPGAMPPQVAAAMVSGPGSEPAAAAGAAGAAAGAAGGMPAMPPANGAMGQQPGMIPIGVHPQMSPQQQQMLAMQQRQYLDSLPQHVRAQHMQAIAVMHQQQQLAFAQQMQMQQLQQMQQPGDIQQQQQAQQQMQNNNGETANTGDAASQDLGVPNPAANAAANDLETADANAVSTDGAVKREVDGTETGEDAPKRPVTDGNQPSVTAPPADGEQQEHTA